MTSIPDPASSFGDDDSRNAINGRDPVTGQFLKGVKGVGGRKRGSRAKLGEEFFAALHADFIEHGPQVIAQVRFKHPGIYLQVLAKVMPQKIEVTNTLDDVSDELLAIMLEQAERMVAERALPGDNAKPVTVIDAQPGPFGPPPPTSAEQRAEAERRDMLDQHDALAAAAPALPSQALPHPVGRAVPVSAREEERRNIAKLHDDDIDPVDPAGLF